MQLLNLRLSVLSKLGQLGAPVALVAIALTGACGQAEPPVADEPATGYEEEVAEKPETLEQTLNSPSEYVGETVTVTGEVVEVYGTQAFSILEEEYFALDEAMLVVADNPDMSMPEVGEYVELTGEVQIFTVAGLEKDYDVVLEDTVVEQVEVAFAEAPFILAKSIADPQP